MFEFAEFSKLTFILKLNLIQNEKSKSETSRTTYILKNLSDLNSLLDDGWRRWRLQRREDGDHGWRRRRLQRREDGDEISRIGEEGEDGKRSDCGID